MGTACQQFRLLLSSLLVAGALAYYGLPARTSLDNCTFILIRGRFWPCYFVSTTPSSPPTLPSSPATSASTQPPATIGLPYPLVVPSTFPPPYVGPTPSTTTPSPSTVNATALILTALSKGSTASGKQKPTESSPPPPSPRPYFVTLLTPEARQQFYRIAKSAFLTKSEMRHEIQRWAAKQPHAVREAIIDIEHELSRQQLDLKKDVSAILEALPIAFTQYASIRDNSALTRSEEKDDLKALFDALPRKVANALRYVLDTAGEHESHVIGGERKEETFLRDTLIDVFTW